MNIIQKKFKILNDLGLKLTIPNLIIFLTALALFVSPFVVDYNTLPKGFELPKVIFWQMSALVIILIATLYYFYKSFAEKSFNIPKSFIVCLALIIILIISSLISPYQEIAIYGNDFRLQGVLTYILIILLSFIVYKNINKSNWHFIAFAFVASGVVQGLMGLSQFVELSKTNPEQILDGIWVNGTFGQANWFAGRLLIATIFSAYFLFIGTEKLNKPIKRILYLLNIVFISLIGICIFLNRSDWGLISLGVAALMILLYEILPHKIFVWLLRISFVVAIGVIAYFVPRYPGYNMRVDIWNNIIFVMFDQQLTFTQILRILFGYGFDTLGEVFKSFSIIPGSLIDRAHNFILDILVANGILVLGFLVAIILKVNHKITKKFNSRIFAFTAIALIVWMFRSFVDESGIVNLLDFFILLAICLSPRLVNLSS